MLESQLRADDLNEDLMRRRITEAVVRTVDGPRATDNALIERLRRCERKALSEGFSPQTIQVISSGLRLLDENVRLSPDLVRKHDVFRSIFLQAPT